MGFHRHDKWQQRMTTRFTASCLESRRDKQGSDRAPARARAVRDKHQLCTRGFDEYTYMHIMTMLCAATLCV